MSCHWSDMTSEDACYKILAQLFLKQFSFQYWHTLDLTVVLLSPWDWRQPSQGHQAQESHHHWKMKWITSYIDIICNLYITFFFFFIMKFSLKLFWSHSSSMKLITLYHQEKKTFSFGTTKGILCLDSWLERFIRNNRRRTTSEKRRWHCWGLWSS